MRPRFVIASLVLALASAGSVSAQSSDIGIDVLVHPETPVLAGAEVTFTPVLFQQADESFIVTGVASQLYGDVTDDANAAIVDTDCTVPDVRLPGELYGAYDWGCEYRVLMSGDPGIVNDTISVTVELADTTVVTFTKDVAVTISTTVGAIHGTLTDDVTGAALEGMAVLVSGPSTRGELTRSDADGAFRFESLEPGEYRLESGNNVLLEPSDYAQEWYDDASDLASADPVTVVAGEVTMLEWSLALGGTIDGVVTDASTGRPLPGVSISWVILLPDGDRAGPIVAPDTDDTGRYRIVGLHDTDVLVCFRKDGYVRECWDDATEFGGGVAGRPGDPIAVAPRTAVTGIDAALAPEAPATTTTITPTTTTTTTTPLVSRLPPTGGNGQLALVAILAVAVGALAVAATRRRLSG